MSKNNGQPLILLDSDVIRHFISGGHLDKLEPIFPGRLVILDKVKNEICRTNSLRLVIEAFIRDHNISVMPFPNDREIIIEYAYLAREFGAGESACMAVAKHQAKFIASSNLKDIKRFCDQHGITYLTTMDILNEAIDRSIMSIPECDQFITDVLAKGSKLPFKCMEDFLKSKT